MLFTHDNWRKPMRKFLDCTFLAFCLFGALVHAEDLAGRITKAAQKSTLDQPGTKPFHLKAVLAPSNARDNDSGRTGEIEVWWKSPTVWRRELRCPGGVSCVAPTFTRSRS
jgi:hypothetical protein